MANISPVWVAAAAQGGGGFAPADVAGLISWHRGDDSSATFDTAPTPDEYASIPDRGSAGSTWAPVAIDAPEKATLAGLTAPLYNSASMEHKGSVSNFTRLSDSAGNAHLFVALHATSFVGEHYFFHTVFSGSQGFRVRSRGTSGQLNTIWLNGAGTAALSIEDGTDLVLNTTHVYEVQKTGTSVECFLDGVSIGSGTLVSPSALDPSFARICRSGASGIYVPEVVLYDAVLAGDDLANVRDYLGRWTP